MDYNFYWTGLKTSAFFVKAYIADRIGLGKKKRIALDNAIRSLVAPIENEGVSAVPSRTVVHATLNHHLNSQSAQINIWESDVDLIYDGLMVRVNQEMRYRSDRASIIAALVREKEGSNDTGDEDFNDSPGAISSTNEDNPHKFKGKIIEMKGKFFKMCRNLVTAFFDSLSVLWNTILVIFGYLFTQRRETPFMMRFGYVIYLLTRLRISYSKYLILSWSPIIMFVGLIIYYLINFSDNVLDKPFYHFSIICITHSLFSVVGLLQEHHTRSDNYKKLVDSLAKLIENNKIYSLNDSIDLKTPNKSHFVLSNNLHKVKITLRQVRCDKLDVRLITPEGRTEFSKSINLNKTGVSELTEQLLKFSEVHKT